MSALRLIGHEEGFEVRLPTSLKPGDTPRLEEIARVSGLRLREVILRDNWQQHDFGNLLAFDQDTKQPLALLCGGQGRPRLIDPAQGEELLFD